MSNYHPPIGAVITLNPDSPYLDKWTLEIINTPAGERARFGPGGEVEPWSPTAQGYPMPWDPILAWVELHESEPATDPKSGTYEVVVGGPPRYNASTGTWVKTA